jgi:hypothetical protein
VHANVTRRQAVTNFGRNVRFTPRHYYAPRTEEEVLQILERHATGRIRVVGSLHSWSALVACDDALTDLSHFDQVRIDRQGDEIWVTAGGGATIKHLLHRLRQLGSVTLPSLGAITEQTIAGAISTGTHGSGRHSLSHYIDEVRIAAYDEATGKPRIYTWSSGPELQAARCSLGCLGVILSVRFRAVPRYFVVETIRKFQTLEEVLACEAEFPLQQFARFPHDWTYYAMQRRVAGEPAEQRRTWNAPLFRAYALLGVDAGLHFLVKLLVWLNRPGLTRWFYKRALRYLLMFQNRTVIDHSEKVLTMEHELFQHLEMELFVPARHFPAAVEYVRHVIDYFAGTADIPEATANQLAEIGMLEVIQPYRGTFTFHYPLFFRRVLPDDTLISMTSPPADGPETYYSMSVFTYQSPRRREPFFALANFAAKSMCRLFSARAHWGKHFPLAPDEVSPLYPRLADFRRLCRNVDPRGVFSNDFTASILNRAANGSSR